MKELPALLNETLQWVALVAIFVMLLGVYRHLSVALGFADRSVATHAGPPVGGKLPKNLWERLRRETPIETIAFVSESCQACQKLLANLESSVGEYGVVGLLYHEDASDAFKEALEGLDYAYPLGVTEIEWEASRIYTTPIMCTLDSDGRVLNKRVTHKLPVLQN